MNLRLRILVLLLFIVCASVTGGFTNQSTSNRRAIYYPPPGDAWKQVRPETVGMNSALLDRAVEYAKTRKQFGKPIGQFQAIQHHCANMLLMTESARSAVYYAAWVMSNDEAESRLAVSIAKMYASDACREVGNLGIQVHGGIGFTWDEPVHFYYKRAKASEIMFGDATYHRERIARLIVDSASEPEKVAATSGD